MTSTYVGSCDRKGQKDHHHNSHFRNRYASSNCPLQKPAHKHLMRDLREAEADDRVAENE